MNTRKLYSIFDPYNNKSTLNDLLAFLKARLCILKKIELIFDEMSFETKSLLYNFNNRIKHQDKTFFEIVHI